MAPSKEEGHGDADHHEAPLYTKEQLSKRQFWIILWLRMLIARRDFRAIFSGIFFPIINLSVAAGISAGFQGSITTLPTQPITFPVGAIPNIAQPPPATDILHFGYVLEGSDASQSISTWNSAISPLLQGAVAASIGPNRSSFQSFSSNQAMADAQTLYFRGDPSQNYSIVGGWRFNSSFNNWLPVAASGNGAVASLDLSYTIVTQSGQANEAPTVLSNWLAQTALALASAIPTNANYTAILSRLTPNLSTFITGYILDIPSQIIPPFIVNGLTFFVGFYAEARVREREDGLEQQLLLSGMYPLAFYGATFVADMILYLGTVASSLILLAICGAISPTYFRFFTLPSTWGYILPMLCYTPSLIGLAYLSSTAAKKSSNIGALFGAGQSVLVFVPYFFLQLVAKNQMSPTLSYLISFLLPSFGLNRALLLVGQSIIGTGTPMTTAQVFDPTQSQILGICIAMLLQGAVLLGVFALILRLRLSNTNVVEWLKGRKADRKTTPVSEETPEPVEASVQVTVDDTGAHVADFPEDEELVKEIQRMRATPIVNGHVEADASREGHWIGEESLRVEDLGKVVDVASQTDGKTKKLVVLEDLWLSVRKGECFGYLGPNGAGKSTSIKILTGLEPATSGRAFFPPHPAPLTSAGYPIEIMRGYLGLCPQHNALWDKLTPRDHLTVYLAIRGVATPKDIQEKVEACLEEVAIEPADRGIRTQYLSGGNKRRLMLAIAAAGRPKLIFLDEPTTGVDVAVRRSIWTAIQNLKRTSSIILTTHSMEEAETLSNRIGILINGKLRCLGTPQRLKTVYGTGYTVTARLDSLESSQAMTEWFPRIMNEISQSSSSARVVQTVTTLAKRMGKTVTFDVKKKEHEAVEEEETDGGLVGQELKVLQSVHAALAGRESAHAVGHVVEAAVTQTTLKQVFIEFAKRQKTTSK